MNQKMKKGDNQGFPIADLIAELLEGMYTELPEKKPKKAKQQFC